MSQVNEGIKDTIEKTNETVSQGLNKASDTVNNVAQKGVESVKNVVTNLSSNSGAFIGLLVVIIVAIICSIVIYWIVTDNIFNKKSITIEKTKIPIKGFQDNSIPILNMPISGNGFKRTYTFWLYLENMNTGKGMYKHVFHIGSDSEMITGSPYVFIDKDVNKLHIRFAKKSPSANAFDINSLNDLNDTNFNTYMKQGVTLDYLPMQRWVHIGIVVHETFTDGAGGIVNLYVDSELSSTTKTNDGTNPDSIQEIKDLDNLNLDKTGDLVVGGTGKSQNSFGFNGLLGKVKIFNYDLNSRDIYNDYSEGPIDSLLAALGYGLRTPLYKLSDI